MSGFETRADAVEAHGKLLSDQLAADLQEAVSASHTKLGADVMGLICQVYTFVFDDELQQAQDLVAKLPSAVEATGVELKATAATYRDADGGNAAGFEGINA
ncbi:hypothetical protein AB0425_33265 [Actinosynnema sp. NPDC051121]